MLKAWIEGSTIYHFDILLQTNFKHFDITSVVCTVYSVQYIVHELWSWWTRCDNDGWVNCVYRRCAMHNTIDFRTCATYFILCIRYCTSVLKYLVFLTSPSYDMHIEELKIEELKSWRVEDARASKYEYSFYAEHRGEMHFRAYHTEFAFSSYKVQLWGC